MSDFKFQLGEKIKHKASTGYMHFIVNARLRHEELDAEGRAVFYNVYRCSNDQARYVDFIENEIETFE